MSDVILSIKDLKVSYGGIEAVKGIKGRRTVGLFHGECVALGMLPMIEDASLRRRTRAVYKKLGLPSRIRYDGDEIFEFIRHDKKTGPDGAITVVKVPRLGECRLDKVLLEDLKAIIGEGVR